MVIASLYSLYDILCPYLKSVKKRRTKGLKFILSIQSFNIFSFNLSASVVKEEGVYWEGIKVTLGCKLLMLLSVDTRSQSLA